jgi:acyl-CoA reductase-like NAD-dependent aldehyde dehydrogenase
MLVSECDAIILASLECDVADHLDVDRLYIDGRFSDGHGAPLDVEDRATEQVFTSVTTADIGQVEAALAAAHRSYLAGTWADVPARRSDP